MHIGEMTKTNTRGGFPNTSKSSFYLNIANNWAFVEVDLNENIVSNIRIASDWGRTGLNDLNLNLRDAIALYGEPSMIFIGPGCGGDQFCFNLNLVYTEKGILIGFQAGDSSNDIRVMPTLPARRVVFFNSPNLKNTLQNVLQVSPDCILKRTLPWQGYRMIRFPEPLNQCY